MDPFLQLLTCYMQANVGKLTGTVSLLTFPFLTFHEHSAAKLLLYLFPGGPVEARAGTW